MKEAGLYPYFHELETMQNTEVKMSGRDLIMIGSNNYLGLTCNEEVIEAGKKALDEFGSGCSGSRFLNGTLVAHTKFEKMLAEFLHKDDVITFGTGFQTNLGILSAIAGRNDIIFCDKENHASIYDGCRLSYAKLERYEHANMEELEAKLAVAPEDKGKLIVTDGVFSMSGDIAKLPEIVALAEKYNARVMVDDAHGFGVLGDHGRGTADHFGLTDKVDIIMGTFSKSLASMGGFCACSAEVAEFIRHTSRPYIFCASIPPSNIACTTKALEILMRDDSRTKNLRHISQYMRRGLDKLGIKYRSADDIIPIIPIYTYEMERTLAVCKALFEEGVYVNPVFPPATPEGECLIRTSYMATHTEELIDRALAKIGKVFKELGLLNDETKGN
jgi:8-amino-7-oxononanoate synthase